MTTISTQRLYNHPSNLQKLHPNFLSTFIAMATLVYAIVISENHRRVRKNENERMKTIQSKMSVVYIRPQSR